MEDVFLKGVTDHELVERVLGGDEKAFREIIIRHNRIIYAAARPVLGNSSDLDDIVQDILIKIFMGLSKFRGDSLLSTWIYRISRNESLNAASKNRPDTLDIHALHDIPSPSDTPDKVYRKKSEQKKLRACLEELEDNYREIIELRYIAEKSYKEIASILDKPIGTVKTDIHRARKRLRRLFTDGSEE